MLDKALLFIISFSPLILIFTCLAGHFIITKKEREND